MNRPFSARLIELRDSSATVEDDTGMLTRSVPLLPFAIPFGEFALRRRHRPMQLPFREIRHKAGAFLDDGRSRASPSPGKQRTAVT
jgi:hypothetical protein